MRTLLLLLISFLITVSTFGQIAVITDAKAGDPANNQMLKSIFESINNRKDIKQVVFIGSISSSGSTNDLETFNGMLNELNPDNYILPGENDIVNNPVGYLYVKDQFDGTRIRLDSTGLFLAGIANYFPRGTHISFSASDIKWLDSLFNAVSKKNTLFFFSPAPLNLSDNWIPVYNLLTTRNSKFLFSAGKKDSVSVFQGIEQFTFHPSIEKNRWNYNIISENDDSLYITKVSDDSLEYIWAVSPVSNKEATFPLEDHNTQNYLADISLEKDTHKEMAAPVLATDDRIFSVSLNGEAEAVDYNGKSLWKINLARTVVTKPIRDKDVLIVGTVEGDLFSINANNGEIVQVIGTDEPIVSDPVFTELENQDGKFKTVLIGSPSGRVTCYDIYSFQLLWDNTTSQKKINYISARDGKFFFSSVDGFLYSGDLSNGNLIWKWNPGKNISLSSYPEIGDKFIYISGSNKTFYAIDLLLGTTAWKKTDFGNTSSILFSQTSGELIVKTLKDEIITADPLTGKIIRKIKAGFPFDNSPSFILIENGFILFTSSDGIIRKIDTNGTTENVFFLGNGLITDFYKTPQGNYLLSDDKGNFYIFTIK